MKYWVDIIKFAQVQGSKSDVSLCNQGNDLVNCLSYRASSLTKDALYSLQEMQQCKYKAIDIAFLKVQVSL